ncbi:hypothetical protein PSTT_04735 [Puccinia striiformis]|uniref:Tet-like 2OG-Fe(II) oxygenase domain-containing protein n=1 Tax=Puccinia striiformis TaxID=27350 RepID=A0A2S4VRK4_9BASI|nr:hypothetical protein PSTT_04735 [Puccinia striiformis]
MFTTDFIAYADSSRKKVVAVVKFHAFSKMDKSLKDRFQHLSHHPVAQSKFQNPNESNAHTYAGKMFSLDGFTCHLSFTWDNFANKSHTDNDASSWTFVTWLPMDKKNENLIKTPLDVCGGEFVLPKLGFGIDFSGFKGVVECVWKATTWAHLTLPSSSPAESVHTQCGYSCQLPEKLETLCRR